MNTTADAESLVQCPYDRNHLILKYRLQKHLCKCRKQYTGKDFAICPFNSTHNILKPELQYHIENCPDKKNLDSYLYHVGEEPKEPIMPISVDIPSPSESWDDEPTVPSYLDINNKITSTLPILRMPPGGTTKSERKEFFLKESKRLDNLTGQARK